MGRTREVRSDARERLLETADRLFYAEGIHSVGIDRIIAEAGVAKMTLYSHFPSKDQLIAEYLRRRGERTRGWLAERTERHAAKSGDWLGALFAALKEWFRSGEFRGCPFINASAELPDAKHPGRAAIAEHESLFAGFIADTLRRAGVRSPGTAAVPVTLLVNGAIVSASCGGDRNAADTALAAARKLLGR